VAPDADMAESLLFMTEGGRDTPFSECAVECNMIQLMGNFMATGFETDREFQNTCSMLSLQGAEKGKPVIFREFWMRTYYFTCWCSGSRILRFPRTHCTKEIDHTSASVCADKTCGNPDKFKIGRLDHVVISLKIV
jgi:hypothetical protein